MSKNKRNRANLAQPPSAIKPPGSDSGDLTVRVLGAAAADRPWFSFRYICGKEFCVKLCKIEQFKSYADKLRMLSELEWKVIESSPKEIHGYEPIPVTALNPKAKMPDKFRKESSVMVFRFGGGGRVGSTTSGRIAGIREGERFYVLFIDSKFKLYDHGG